MYKSLGYTFDEINCYDDSQKLCIGFIIECNKGSDYGILYQYNDEKNHSECNGSAIYFFRKNTDFVISAKTCVTFVKNLSNSWKRNFEVSNVHLLDEYDIYIIQSDDEKKSYYQTSSTKTMEELMTAGKKFIVIVKDGSDYTGRIYFPTIDEELKLINFYFFTVCFQEEPNTVFESYIYNLVNSEYISYSNINFIVEGLNRISNYVQSLDIQNILLAFSVHDAGRFQCRPGRDDHYIYTKYAQCALKDKYLQQLTKLKNEVTGYYNCLGRDEDDFDQINNEDTENLRNEIAQKYNAGEHLIYLLSEFICETETTHKYTQLASKCLTSFIKDGDEILFANKVGSLSKWIDIISTYNKF